MKLYKVTLRGMTKGYGSEMAHGEAYVVAANADEAYQMVRKYVDKKDLGFAHQREMQSVELIADEREYNDTGYRLYVKRKEKPNESH